jgi:NADPH:quinone reductase
MANAIVMDRPGGPEVLHLVQRELSDPGPGEIRMRQGAVGLNFIDVYHRSGLYQVASLPFTPGVEGAGVVEAVGPDVTDIQPGDRVAYVMEPGGYADVRLLRAARAVKLPDAITDETAAAAMLKGLTAQYLLKQTLPLAPGDRVLLHAAAGGVGSITCAWARHLGIQVIATAGGPEKCALALAAGASHAIDYRREDFVARVRELTSGAGVRAAFDGVGKETFLRSLDCLAPFGMLVSFGQSSGAVPPFDPVLLSTKGSLYLTRPTLATYVADRRRLLAMADELFAVMAAGVVKVDVRQRYPLADAARAHADLEGRRTSGSTVLLP